jgi:hypothetical protein
MEQLRQQAKRIIGIETAVANDGEDIFEQSWMAKE